MKMKYNITILILFIAVIFPLFLAPMEIVCKESGRLPVARCSSFRLNILLQEHHVPKGVLVPSTRMQNPGEGPQA